MDARTELGEFLRTRRSALNPADVGLTPFGGRRRVAGLRREELAQLAGVSVDYYTRLEQGRGRNVSDAVLDALARALRLDDAETRHLRDLAHPTRVTRRTKTQRVRPQVQQIMDALVEVPAVVLGRRMDVLAWNGLAAALITDFGALPAKERNMIRLSFGDDESFRDLYPDWPTVGKETVAYLRQDAGRYPDDPQLLALVGEMSVRSAQFRKWWAAHPVHSKTHGTKRFDHPLVGLMTLTYDAFIAADDPDQMLISYTAEPGSASAAALSRLAALTSDAKAERAAL
ncbi:helix-turn-helix transcriptional regulator [Fodinicola acaciae]|uniref:helix-turn-helix transcriptional regulator n=1 Tax=Fodinicola acaciae TaxID=2681555 RepID=UPI0013CF7D12|nr:helix-turn-helix transcriptional regulator [Fodinicola acaciae]